ncbi:50S ribosomal protein L9 [Flavobacteriales bacterium]|jgi:large subunit ribosomal protein L9|nr:50S ribosomal protein L9 [Flavobacteriales bacterium]MDA9864166.1 50S ribosomal protein L9 [Flavobacteriales bacterium]
MDVILKQDVDRLGAKNDIVTVKNGYARNYLIPQGFATAATESARKVVAETLRQQSHKALKALDDAKAFGEKIAGISLKIGAKAGESGKIFGSVNNIQLAEAMSKAGHPVDRKNIDLGAEVIRDLGTYTAKVKLHKEVTVDISFEVVAE